MWWVEFGGLSGLLFGCLGVGGWGLGLGAWGLGGQGIRSKE